jgi:hypothetical protein
VAGASGGHPDPLSDARSLVADELEGRAVEAGDREVVALRADTVRTPTRATASKRGNPGGHSCAHLAWF